MSISSYSSDSSAASQPLSQDFIQSISHPPVSRSGMVQPVIQEMYATVHAAGSSLFGLFSSCTRPSIRHGTREDSRGKGGGLSHGRHGRICHLPRGGPSWRLGSWERLGLAHCAAAAAAAPGC
eukprot:scaffold3380_cov118-Isochrysis_galbana.AAC.8